MKRSDLFCGWLARDRLERSSLDRRGLARTVAGWGRQLVHSVDDVDGPTPWDVDPP